MQGSPGKRRVSLSGKNAPLSFPFRTPEVILLKKAILIIVLLLCLLAGAELHGEFVRVVEHLLGLSAEKGILLKTRLVLDDHSRYAEAFQCAHVKEEMLQLAAGVAVKDNGL